MQVNETKFATVQDVERGQKTFYDAFICYTTEDKKFLFSMIDRLEKSRGLQLFVPGRDDLPGAAEHTITAYLIEKRCKRVVILISRQFLKSEACDFQVKFAHSLSPGARSKKLIPVILERNTPIPRILRFLANCDLSNSDTVDWVWDRLYSAIIAPVGHEEEESSDPFNMSGIRLQDIEYPSQRRLVENKDVSNNLTGVQSSDGIKTTYVFSSRERRPVGSVEEDSSDPFDMSGIRLQDIEYPSQRRLVENKDVSNNLTGVQSSDGIKTTDVFSSRERRPVGSLGEVSSDPFDMSGIRLQDTENPSQRRLVENKDVCNNLTDAQSSDGIKTTDVFSSRERRPVGSVGEVSSDPFDMSGIRLQVVENLSQRRLVENKDVSNNLTDAQSSDGIKTTDVFLSRERRPVGSVEEDSSDPFDVCGIRLQDTENPSQRRLVENKDVSNNLTGVQSSDGSKTTYVFSSRERRPVGSVEEVSSDPFDMSGIRLQDIEYPSQRRLVENKDVSNNLTGVQSSDGSKMTDVFLSRERRPVGSVEEDSSDPFDMSGIRLQDIEYPSQRRLVENKDVSNNLTDAQSSDGIKTTDVFLSRERRPVGSVEEESSDLFDVCGIRLQDTENPSQRRLVENKDVSNNLTGVQSSDGSKTTYVFSSRERRPVGSVEEVSSDPFEMSGIRLQDIEYPSQRRLVENKDVCNNLTDAQSSDGIKTTDVFSSRERRPVGSVEEDSSDPFDMSCIKLQVVENLSQRRLVENKDVSNNLTDAQSSDGIKTTDVFSSRERRAMECCLISMFFRLVIPRKLKKKSFLKNRYTINDNI